MNRVRRQLRAVMAGMDEPWRPPALIDFASGKHVIAFDQTLTSTGWIAMHTWHPGVITVEAYGTLRPRTGYQGFMATWDKARQLWKLAHDVLYEWQQASTIHVLEHPLIGPGSRTESSLVAGSVLYSVTMGEVVPVASRHAKKVLTGKPDAGKREVAEALARYIPESRTRRWNEHIRDGAALGLAHLWDLAHYPG